MIEFEVIGTLVSGDTVAELVWADCEGSALDAFWNVQPNGLEFSSVEVWKI